MTKSASIVKETTLKTTIPGCLIELTPDMCAEMDHFQFDYSYMFRKAFNRYVTLEKEIDDPDSLQQAVQVLEKQLAEETNYPIRVCKDAVQDARELVSARHALMVDYHDEWAEKLNRSLAKRDRLLNTGANPYSQRVRRLEQTIQKRRRKVDMYAQHILERTFPPIIFGGRKNYKELQKGTISKETWYELRNGRVSSRGDSTKGGNPNLRVIQQEDGSFALQVISNRKYMVGKSVRYEKMTMPLYIATKRSKKNGQNNGRNYPKLMKEVLESGKAYQVEIIKRNGNYHVHIAVSELCPSPFTDIRGYKAMDTNIDGLALCEIDLKGNPLKFEWKGEGGLQYYPSDKRSHTIWTMMNEIIIDCRNKRYAFVYEKLSAMTDKELYGKKKRKIHQFCYKQILEVAAVLCTRYGVPFIEINPAYTSVIARLKYQQRYRVSTHLAAALVIGRRGMKKKEQVPLKFRKLLTKKQREMIWKKQENQQWKIVKGRITTLLKKQNLPFYRYHQGQRMLFS